MLVDSKSECTSRVMVIDGGFVETTDRWRSNDLWQDSITIFVFLPFVLPWWWLCVWSAVMRMMILEYVSLISLQNAHPILELLLLLEYLQWTPIELNHYFGLVNDPPRIISLKVCVAHSSFEVLCKEWFLYVELRRWVRTSSWNFRELMMLIVIIITWGERQIAAIVLLM